MSRAARWYKNLGTDWTRPAQEYIDIGAGNDSTVHDPPLRGFILGTSGAVAVVEPGDPNASPVVLPPLAAGVVHPCAASKIRATGTTATGIIGVR